MSEKMERINDIYKRELLAEMLLDMLEAESDILSLADNMIRNKDKIIELLDAEFEIMIKRA